MRHRRTFARTLLAGLVSVTMALGAPAAGAGQPSPAGLGFIERPAHVDAPAIAPPATAQLHAPPSMPSSPAYPLYRWPLAAALDDRLVVVNYVDHDPGGGLLDYDGGAHTYDGHRGIDYVLPNFRLMDRGSPILAAASGTVAYISASAPGAFDRLCGSTPPNDGTWVWVENHDGTYSEYYHLRSWSLTVQVGDPVHIGQLLGLVGSSGYSTAPHLHFETGDYFSGPYQHRDPYTGPENPLPSLWQSQESYQGDDALRFVDAGVFSDDAVGGSVFNTTYCDIQEGIHEPVVFGVDEPHIDLWVQFRGNAGDPFRIELRRPNGTVWAGFDDVLPQDARLDWFWVYWFWSGNVGPADYGTWKLRAIANGVLSREHAFEVGPTSVYGPRLRPAGRSFRINGSAQMQALSLTPLSPPVTYALVGARPEMTLSGSTLTIGATSSQPTRSHFLQVVATDGAARRDTAWYHVVDMSKAVEPGVGVADPIPASIGPSFRAHPIPSRGPVTFEFDVARAVFVDIYDVAGRRVRQLTIDGGSGRFDWDGRNDAGRDLPSGVYLARLSADRGVSARRLVIERR